MRISDWSSDVCSSDLLPAQHLYLPPYAPPAEAAAVADRAFHTDRCHEIARQGRHTALPGIVATVIRLAVVVCQSRNHVCTPPLAVDVGKWPRHGADCSAPGR